MNAKSYSKFTPEDVLNLDIKTIAKAVLGKHETVEPSAFLLQTLADNEGLPMATEKAKSEHIVAPILKEIRRNNLDKMTYFSGYTFNVDKKRGLVGRCDFILSLKPHSINIEAPLFCMVESKSEAPDDANAIAQCIAEMYAARLFNEQHNNVHIKIIYGAITNGYEWIFAKLEGDTAFIDITNRYPHTDLPRILGALQHIINQF